MGLIRTALIVLGTVYLASAAAVIALENKGADKMLLKGGKRGPVPFPHHLHQETSQDCNICHVVFPQEKDAIETLKSRGKLKKKHVMNKLCTACHKKQKKAGKKSGPTSCAKCHQKK